MTPAARYAAAIDVLDRAADGQPAEKALTAWGRSNRYAGSKDRAAVRDHVYDVLRQKRSVAYLGGGTTGRALILVCCVRKVLIATMFLEVAGTAQTHFCRTKHIFLLVRWMTLLR